MRMKVGRHLGLLREHADGEYDFPCLGGEWAAIEQALWMVEELGVGLADIEPTEGARKSVGQGEQEHSGEECNDRDNYEQLDECKTAQDR